MLKKVNVYQENGKWFMRLEYESEDNAGKFLFVIPKLDFPAILINEPIMRFHDFDDFCLDKSVPTVDLNERLIARKGLVINPVTGERFNSSAVYILIEPKIYKMTKEEIEKKLGYKIEIVPNKEGE